MPEIHNLKIEENYLHNLLNGRKKVEIRLNDRDYQLGDALKFYMPNSFREDPDKHYVYFTITHIHSGLGLEWNYVALSVEKSVALN